MRKCVFQQKSVALGLGMLLEMLLRALFGEYTFLKPINHRHCRYARGEDRTVILRVRGNLVAGTLGVSNEGIPTCARILDLRDETIIELHACTELRPDRMGTALSRPVSYTAQLSQLGLRLLLHVCGLGSYHWGWEGLLGHLRNSKTTLGSIITLCWRAVYILYRVLNALFVPAVAVRYITTAVLFQLIYEVSRLWLRAGRWVMSQSIPKERQVHTLKKVRVQWFLLLLRCQSSLF